MAKAPEKKKEGFFGAIAHIVTGKTAEQRRADAEMEQKRRSIEMQAYRQEQLKQAVRIGHAKAKYQADQQIRNVGKPKPLFNLGDWGKTQAGFDPLNFGGSFGSAPSAPKQRKAPAQHYASPMDIANMQFPDITMPQPTKARRGKR